MSTTTLSAADLELSEAQQAEILKLKQAWTAAYEAGDTEGMNRAHAEAESIRATAGYSGGADGSAEDVGQFHIIILLNFLPPAFMRGVPRRGGGSPCWILYTPPWPSAIPPRKRGGQDDCFLRFRRTI